MEIFLNYLFSFGQYLLSENQNLLVGGVIIVGVVIALMGILKSVKPIKRLKNSTLRKVILAWLSVFLTVGLTVASMFLNQLKQDHFWAMCVINSIGTILIYWMYENTALRSLLEKIGRSAINKLLHHKPKTIEEAKQLSREIHEDAESLLKSVNSESSVQSKYKDDDLKNL